MDNIYNRFRHYVKTNELILPSDKILLSLSAGKDSMFLLHLIRKLQYELEFTIGIFHLNHLTRGEESDKDEFFIKTKSEEYNIPCYIERFDFKKNKIKGLSFEEHARDKRYSLINNICQTEGYNRIATAHNMNDNAETVLMRILSGTGIAGIKGILPKRKNIIRPVMFAEINDIYSYLTANRIEWREDQSNSENLYLRNYLRNIVIPSITSRIPGAEESLFNLSNHAVENQALLYNLTDKLYPDVISSNETGTVIDVTGFKDNIPLIKFYISRVLYDIFGIKMKISIYKEIIRRYYINTANMLLYEKDNLIIKKSMLNDRILIIIKDKKETYPVFEEWEYAVPFEESSIIYLNEIKKEFNISTVNYDFYCSNKDKPDIVFLQPQHDLSSIIIRNRRPGDRITIENGTKKIKEIMIEKKLDSRIKNNIPLIVADNQIAAYLPGLLNSNNNRVACNFHIINDTKRILAFFFRDY